MKMQTSDNGLNLIKRFEGLRLTSYRCAAGVWTIGWGHTEMVTDGMTITEAEAEQYLKDDLRPAERMIAWTGITVNQNQFDALVSFIFNVGSGNFKGSTLLKKIKANPNDETIRDEFMKWCRAGGKELEGLRKRREAEAELYFV